MLPAGREQFRATKLQPIVFTLAAVGGAWVVAGWILAGSSSELLLGGLGLTGVAIVMAILENWRRGVYLFFVWLLFEDLARKYLGNNMYIYFGKDVLVGVTYLACFTSLRRQRALRFRPAFLMPFMFFVWLGVLQVFNPNSPSILYGALGLKLYFYYAPLVFVGYALVETEHDLRKILMFNVGLALLVAALGTTQAIRGPEFLNPQELAPELRPLGQLYRTAPVSGELLYRPTSVFVSDGRFAAYLILAWLLVLGTTGYLFLQAKRGRKLTLVALATLAAGIIFSGSRGTLMWTGGSTLILVAALLWGVPWRWRQGHRLIKAIRWSVLLAGIAVLVLVEVFPRAVGSRLDFYSETLLPASPHSELVYRSWDYPVKNLELAFQYPDWPYGYGLGTASLGVQYVSRFLGEPTPGIGVENGFGGLILEMGILGLVLWLVWVLTLLFSGWKVITRLRETPYFPVGFAIYWFIFLLTIPFTFMSLAPYQNFVLNAYFWLLVGVLFRLPSFAGVPPRLALQADSVRAAAVPRPGWATSLVTRLGGGR